MQVWQCLFTALVVMSSMYYYVRLNIESLQVIDDTTSL